MYTRFYLEFIFKGHNGGGRGVAPTIAPEKQLLVKRSDDERIPDWIYTTSSPDQLEPRWRGNPRAGVGCGPREVRSRPDIDGGVNRYRAVKFATGWGSRSRREVGYGRAR